MSSLRTLGFLFRLQFVYTYLYFSASVAETWISMRIAPINVHAFDSLKFILETKHHFPISIIRPLTGKSARKIRCNTKTNYFRHLTFPSWNTYTSVYWRIAKVHFNVSYSKINSISVTVICNEERAYC